MTVAHPDRVARPRRVAVPAEHGVIGQDRASSVTVTAPTAHRLPADPCRGHGALAPAATRAVSAIRRARQQSSTAYSFVGRRF